MPSTSYNKNISEKEKKTALKSIEALESLHLNSSSKKNIEITIGEKDIILPKMAFPILQEILTRIAKGQSINFEGQNEEMTTQEAANFLNVSRPYFIKLLDQNKIAHHKIGNRRKVLTSDVVDFKNKLKATREKGLLKLSVLSQEMEGEDY